MNQKTKSLIKGSILITVPICILLVVGYYYAQTIFNDMCATMMPDVKGFGGITIDHPPVGLFDNTAQILIGIGLCLSSICWGAAKIIKALRS